MDSKKVISTLNEAKLPIKVVTKPQEFSGKGP